MTNRIVISTDEKLYVGVTGLIVIFSNPSLLTCTNYHHKQGKNNDVHSERVSKSKEGKRIMHLII